MADIQSIKKRFGIIGNSPLINRAIDIACQVAPIDITVLILGESGVGKEVFPKIIHELSPRKHGKYIAVNCGAIPEGTIDSELFGHEKGSFTGAHEARQGYFEAANGGTIFLDEVADLPLATQVRLLRVLESGEFIKVGSSKVQKTNVRVVAATNVNVTDLVQRGKFRQDLYYRLSSVPIYVPPLRERKEDIYPLFRSFVSEFSERNKIPHITLTPEARTVLENYRWEGNVRQLKNVSEQICIIEKSRDIDADTLKSYLPDEINVLPVLYGHDTKESSGNGFTEREILYKVLFDMKKDINKLQSMINEIMSGSPNANFFETQNDFHPHSEEKMMTPFKSEQREDFFYNIPQVTDVRKTPIHEDIEQEHPVQVAEVVEDNASLSLAQNEKNLIKRSLDKHKGNRKNAANELGISERTLYRKINEYGLE
ncbi:sigma-54 dependent transcriptional regulator [Odoribacter sp. OttesenSCG-928-L07]|nr:sigma-54 dependent transcriptional regulator [Odoribacter sp. OttesenSCG-928-L07]MDL2239324.1 sigma-54 dependent transcriptional regulator [Bacteroidales bacterium OttesenSCG-928-L14]MDL2240369.1 sigma-54 dependent transcriptional regulator [Bacteroidales bacterium OttesenSCG-928-K22]